MDLQTLINAQPANGKLELSPGEFFGQIVIDRAITIVGIGKSTWIGSRSAPTVRILALGVKLQNLMVEVTSGPQDIAVEAAPGMNPVLENVIVKGLMVGVSPHDKAEDETDPTRISFLPPPPISAGISDHHGTTVASVSPPPGTTQPVPTPPKPQSRLSWLKFAAAGTALLCVVLATIFYVQSEKTRQIEKLREAERAAVLEKERIEKEKLAQELELARLKEADRLRALEKERVEHEKSAKERELARLRETERLKNLEKERPDKESQEKEAARLKEAEKEIAQGRGTGSASEPSGRVPDYQALRLFRQVMGIVQKNYVREVPTKELVQGAINGLLQSLDPWSHYLNEDLWKELPVANAGNGGAEGLEFTVDNGVLKIVWCIEKGPAYRAGLQPEDTITKIDGESTKNITLSQAAKKMRGPVGSKITLTVMREGSPQLKDYTLTRENVTVQPVKIQMLQPNYGYVRRIGFHERSDEYLAAAIEKAGGDDRIKGMVLDLRNNPGGFLDQAVKVANLFVDKGLIVRTDGRAKDQRMEFRATKTGKHYKFRIAVLVNEGSAGASEIVAGCIQDHDRGLILGTRSRGMGSLTTIVPLENDSGIRLTTAKNYTPQGRDIEDAGIIPDVDLKEQVKAQLEAEEREAKLGKKSAGPNAAAGKPDPSKDIVLKKALEWLKSDVNVKAAKTNR